MLNVKQNRDGFIQMARRFPNTAVISITFTDGTTGKFSGARLNELYDDALAAFRLGNGLDAKGYQRNAANIHRRNEVSMVTVHPGMAP